MDKLIGIVFFVCALSIALKDIRQTLDPLFVFISTWFFPFVVASSVVALFSYLYRNELFIFSSQKRIGMPSKFACPACNTIIPETNAWECGSCGNVNYPKGSRAYWSATLSMGCKSCGIRADEFMCPNCYHEFPLNNDGVITGTSARPPGYPKTAGEVSTMRAAHAHDTEIKNLKRVEERNWAMAKAINSVDAARHYPKAQKIKRKKKFYRDVRDLASIQHDIHALYNASTQNAPKDRLQQAVGDLEIMAKSAPQFLQAKKRCQKAFDDIIRAEGMSPDDPDVQQLKDIMNDGFDYRIDEFFNPNRDD